MISLDVIPKVDIVTNANGIIQELSIQGNQIHTFKEVKTNMIAKGFTEIELKFIGKVNIKEEVF